MYHTRIPGASWPPNQPFPKNNELHDQKEILSQAKKAENAKAGHSSGRETFMHGSLHASHASAYMHTLTK